LAAFSSRDSSPTSALAKGLSLDMLMGYFLPISLW
jgi:hypothetical protein